MKFFRRDRISRALSVRVTVLLLKAGPVRLWSGTFRIVRQGFGIIASTGRSTGLMDGLYVWTAILGEPFGRAGNKVEWIEKFAF